MSWALIAAGLLVAAGGLAAGVAAAAIRRVDLYRWAARGEREARAAQPLLQAPDRMLRSANALAGIGMAAAGAGVAPQIAHLPWPLGVATLALVVVPLFVTIGYALPRALGRRWPEPIMERGMPWLRRVGVVVAPIRGVPGGDAGRKGFGQGAPRPPVEADDESLDREDLKALAGVLAFTERAVREVMTPRTDIVAVPAGAAIEEVSRTFATEGYSRMPVYTDTLDDIGGTIYVFDLLKTPPGGGLPLRPVTTTPASKRCAELLFEMQRDRRQVAVVLDEYGGTAGIVTLEDLLEELVGEIFDEYDGIASSGGGAPEGLRATGATPVAEVAMRFDVVLPDVAETVGGLLTTFVGRIPRAGERYLLAGLEFDVVEATPNRLSTVIVRRGPVAATPLDPGARA